MEMHTESRNYICSSNNCLETISDWLCCGSSASVINVLSWHACSFRLSQRKTLAAKVVKVLDDLSSTQAAPINPRTPISADFAHMARVIGLQLNCLAAAATRNNFRAAAQIQTCGGSNKKKGWKKSKKKNASSNFSPSLVQCNYCAATPPVALGITNCECAAANRQLPLPVINMQNSLTAHKQTLAGLSPLLQCQSLLTNNYVHIDARGFCHRRHTGVVAGIAGHGALDF